MRGDSGRGKNGWVVGWEVWGGGGRITPWRWRHGGYGEGGASTSARDVRKCHGSMEANNEKEREEANLCQAGERCLSISRIGSCLGVGGEVRGSGEAGSALEDVL